MLPIELSPATLAWLASVWQRAPEDRVALEIQGQWVGSVTPSDASWFSQTIEGLELADHTLSILPLCGPDANAALSHMASALKQAKRLGKWRNELLPVTNDSGDTLGLVERAAARALGIKTFAVHLMLFQGQDIWLQQRALDKATDPGLWDTCAGGLVAGGDSFIHSLYRETAEEAGLDIAQLIEHGAKLTFSGKVTAQRLLYRADELEGLLREELMVWGLQLAPNQTVAPVNQDGEVAQFRLVSPATLLQLLEQRQLTLEAAVCARFCLLQR